MKGETPLLPKTWESRSAGDDESPFLHDKSNVFYFSSEGHIGFGGKDIFRSKWNPDVDWWGPAENVGAPINSSRDETHYVINGLQTTGYVTSDRQKCSAREQGL